MIFAALFLCAFSAIAKDLPDERKCFDHTSMKVSDVMDCVSNIRTAVESDLNETYQASMGQFKSAAKLRASLQKSQRLWISYRDTVCNPQPASKLKGVQLGINLCVIKITKERIADIETFYTISR